MAFKSIVLYEKCRHYIEDIGIHFYCFPAFRKCLYISCINVNKTATLPMVPFDTQSCSNFQHFIFLWANTVCFEKPNLNPNNHYH